MFRAYRERPWLASIENRSNAFPARRRETSRDPDSSATRSVDQPHTDGRLSGCRGGGRVPFGQMGLLERIRSGTFVPDDSPPLVSPGRRISLREAGTRVDAGEDVLLVAREVLDQAGRAKPDEIKAMVAERPELTGVPRADALLAGVAEYLACAHEIEFPGWTSEPARFLDRFWFVSTEPGFRAIALAQTPVALEAPRHPLAGALAADESDVQRSEILDLLHLLADRLAEQGLKGEMYVVGGAAIALDLRRAARRPGTSTPSSSRSARSTTLRRRSRDERGLPEGWLNDAVKGFLSGPDEAATPVLDLPGLSVATASPRIILAMKVLAHRPGEDDADVHLLADQLGLTTAAEVLAVATDVYGDRLDTAARFFVEELFPASSIGAMPSLADFPRVPLTFGPSPVHRLERLSEHLGGEVEIWAKREDCNSGLAYGGNKVRKLEYLAADALAQGCDTLVSIGGVQSNHTRQVAAVAAHLGLACVLVQEHWVDWDDPGLRAGRQHPPLADHGRRRAALRCRLRHRLPAELGGGALRRRRARRQALPDPGRRLRPPARRPRVRRAGPARSPTQEAELGVFFDTIVVCSVTGSTQAGMIAGFAGQERERTVLGIDGSATVQQTWDQIARIARRTAEAIGLGRPLADEEIVLLDEWHAGTYGIPDAKTIEAIRLCARLEGMLTDPVYEGKSMAALIDLVRDGRIEPGSKVLYAHLGGQPALNAYSTAFSPGDRLAGLSSFTAALPVSRGAPPRT